MPGVETNPKSSFRENSTKSNFGNTRSNFGNDLKIELENIKKTSGGNLDMLSIPNIDPSGSSNQEQNQEQNQGQ